MEKYLLGEDVSFVDYPFFFNILNFLGRYRDDLRYFIRCFFIHYLKIEYSGH